MELIAIQESGGITDLRVSLPQSALEVMQTIAEMYQKVGFKEPWIAYLAIEDSVCVGTCAFKSPPEKQRVEIAYFTFPDYEGRGIATRMVSQLVAIAKKAAPSVQIFAQTLPERNASTRILEKTGFNKISEVEHAEDGIVWEWELTDQALRSLNY